MSVVPTEVYKRAIRNGVIISASGEPEIAEE